MNRPRAGHGTQREVALAGGRIQIGNGSCGRRRGMCGTPGIMLCGRTRKTTGRDPASLLPGPDATPTSLLPATGLDPASLLPVGPDVAQRGRRRVRRRPFKKLMFVCQ